MSTLFNNSGTAKTFDPGRFFTHDAPEYDPQTTNLLNLSRSIWSQSMAQMYPIQDQLINYAENPKFINDQVQSAQHNVDQSFAGQGALQQRELSGLGVTPTADQATSMQKQTALSKGLSEAGAMNTARESAAQTQQGILRGF